MSATAYRGWNLGSIGIYQCLLWVGFGAKFETKKFSYPPFLVAG